MKIKLDENLPARLAGLLCGRDRKQGTGKAFVTKSIGKTLAELRRLEMLRDFDSQLRRALSRMWTEIKVR